MKNVENNVERSVFKRKKWLIPLCVVLVICTMVAIMLIRTKLQMEGIKFTNIDLTKVEDGTYSGKSSTDIVKVEVEVTVKDHKIDKIDLIKHRNGKGAPAEVLIDEMVEKQTTEVDTVSGATCSSKCIRKAVENALEQGIK